MTRAWQPGADGSGIRLSIRLTPGASRNAIGSISTDASGQTQLRVMVTAIAENGKANSALIKLLAKAGKWPKSSVEIVAGLTDRNKILRIAGDPAVLMAQLDEMTGGQKDE